MFNELKSMSSQQRALNWEMWLANCVLNYVLSAQQLCPIFNEFSFVPLTTTNND